MRTAPGFGRGLAPKLWNEYDDNEVAADRKYLGKVVELQVGGKLAKDARGYFLGGEVVGRALLPASQAQRMSPRDQKWYNEGYPPNVLCHIHPAALEPFESPAPGTICTVRGVCKGKR